MKPTCYQIQITPFASMLNYEIEQENITINNYYLTTFKDQIETKGGRRKNYNKSNVMYLDQNNAET